MIPDPPAGTLSKCTKTAYKSVDSDASDAGLGERVDEGADGAGEARVFRFEAHRRVFQRVGRGEVLEGMDRFGKQAQAMILSARAREAFDTAKEPASIAKLFEADEFGEGAAP